MRFSLTCSIHSNFVIFLYIFSVCYVFLCLMWICIQIPLKTMSTVSYDWIWDMIFITNSIWHSLRIQNEKKNDTTNRPAIFSYIWQNKDETHACKITREEKKQTNKHQMLLFDQIIEMAKTFELISGNGVSFRSI